MSRGSPTGSLAEAATCHEMFAQVVGYHRLADLFAKLARQFYYTLAIFLTDIIRVLLLL